MTREEAIIILKHNVSACLRGTEWGEALNMAIKALEQETVSKEVYDHEYFLRKEFEVKIDELQRQLEEQAVKAESILNKIRAEIEQEIIPRNSDQYDHEAMWQNMGLRMALKVIGKYKAEIEVDNGNNNH